MLRITRLEADPIHILSYHRLNESYEKTALEIEVVRYYVEGMPKQLNAIVAMSDLQGRGLADERLPGLIAAEELTVLSELSVLPPTNSTGIILAGDFFARHGLDRKGGTGNVTEIWDEFSRRYRWATGVAGNHDIFSDQPSEPAFNEFRKGSGKLFLDGESIELDGLRIAGISGIIASNQKPWRKSSNEYLATLRRLLHSNPDILILHEGPDDPDQDLPGNEEIRKEILRSVKEPLFLICGHKRWENGGLNLLGRSCQVLNVNERVIVLQNKTS
jgi:hypothetical protein